MVTERKCWNTIRVMNHLEVKRYKPIPRPIVKLLESEVHQRQESGRQERGCLGFQQLRQGKTIGKWGRDALESGGVYSTRKVKAHIQPPPHSDTTVESRVRPETCGSLRRS